MRTEPKGLWAQRAQPNGGSAAYTPRISVTSPATELRKVHGSYTREIDSLAIPVYYTSALAYLVRLALEPALTKVKEVPRTSLSLPPKQSLRWRNALVTPDLG